jgi:hypothetical protein
MCKQKLNDIQKDIAKQQKILRQYDRANRWTAADEQEQFIRGMKRVLLILTNQIQVDEK